MDADIWIDSRYGNLTPVLRIICYTSVDVHISLKYEKKAK